MRKKKLTRHVGVLFTDEIYNLLIEVTDEEEVSLSEFIRKIVEEKLNLSAAKFKKIKQEEF